MFNHPVWVYGYILLCLHVILYLEAKVKHITVAMQYEGQTAALFGEGISVSVRGVQKAQTPVLFVFFLGHSQQINKNLQEIQGSQFQPYFRPLGPMLLNKQTSIECFDCLFF